MSTDSVESRLRALEKEADALLKEHPEQMDALAEEIKKTMEDCKNKGKEFDFYDLMRIFIQAELIKNTESTIEMSNL